MTAAVGQRLPVVDGALRVRGRLEYVLDLEVPRMAMGRILRSPHAHARVLRVDTSKALALPGVVAVLTGADVAGLCYGRFLPDQAVLAQERVRFVGDAVAAVAAVDAEVAAEACQLIEVDYEPLPAVFDALAALHPGAPLLHDPRPPLRPETAGMFCAPAEPGNLCTSFHLRHGDVERGLAASAYVFTDTFHSPAAQHVPLEPHVAVASFDGRLTVWSSTQMPHAIRAQLADLVGMPLSQVRVLTANLGGGFGSKGSLRVEPLAAFLSRAAGRPVKLTLDRDEEFVTVTKHATTVMMTTGVDRDGTFLARQVTAHFNTGAYADVGPMVARNAGCAMAGPYRIPNVAIDSHAVWTNVVPAGAFRGFGVSQGAWAYESQADIIAAHLGVDPVELRRRNLLRPGDRYVTGERMDDLHYDRLLDRAARAVSWGSPPRGDTGPRRRGKAVTTLLKATITPSTSTAALRLDDDGSLTVLTSSVDLGQGSKTALAQLAADALAVAVASVHVSHPDTDLTPYDQQTSSSRTTYSMGTAVLRAADDVRRQLLALAAEHLEAATEDLELHDASVRVRGAPGRAVGYARLLRAARLGNLQGSGTFVTEGGLDPETGQGIGSVHWHHGAVGCEVEVDVETGKVDVLQLAASVFAGRVVNPQLCELQVEGSLLFGLGQTLFEEILYSDGQVANANLSDYMIPAFDDLPGRVHVALVEADGAGEIHGVGETALPAVSPAIANAVHAAVGIRIKELPVTPEKVLCELVAQRVRSDAPQPQEVAG